MPMTLRKLMREMRIEVWKTGHLTISGYTIRFESRHAALIAARNMVKR